MSSRNLNGIDNIPAPGLGDSQLYPRAPSTTGNQTASIQSDSNALLKNAHPGYKVDYANSQDSAPQQMVLSIPFAHPQGPGSAVYYQPPTKPERKKRGRSMSFFILMCCCCCLIMLGVAVYVLYPRFPSVIPEKSLADFSLGLEILELQLAFSGTFQAVVVNNAYFEIRVTNFQAVVVFQSLIADADMVIPKNGGNVLDAGLILPPGEEVIAELVFDTDIGLDDIGTGINLIDSCIGNDPLFAIMTDTFITVEYIGIALTVPIKPVAIEFQC